MACIKTYNIYLPFFAIAWKKSFCKKKRSMDLHFAGNNRGLFLILEANEKMGFHFCFFIIYIHIFFLHVFDKITVIERILIKSFFFHCKFFFLFFEIFKKFCMIIMRSKHYSSRALQIFRHPRKTRMLAKLNCNFLTVMDLPGK